MTEITLKLRIVTPLFIGGAEQEQVAELREPSIKGLLRFWYRVIYPNDPESEARIFGGQGKNQGQSSILLRISKRNLSSGYSGYKDDEHWNKTKTAYLGYGVIVRDKVKKKEITTRPYIKSGGSFNLTIRFRQIQINQSHQCVLNADDIQRVKRTLWAWLMFGGLGARTRNGFGSLMLESATGLDDLPDIKVKNKEDLRSSILEFIKSISPLPTISAYPEYTRWSNHSRCLITGQGKNGEEALEKLGCKISSLRSYQSLAKLAWVTPDHDLMDKFVRNVSNPAKPPLRSAFGLPHNYFFSSSQQAGEVNLMDANGKKGRRGSPVFFSVYEFSTGNQACIVALFLPAKLIPTGKQVRISIGEPNKPSYRCHDIGLPDNFTAVTDVLDELAKTDNHGLKVHP
jgi:CRISPR-associated protein Cmr1